MKHLLTALLLTACLVQASVTETVRETHALKKGGTLTLENVNGSLTLEGWDREEVSLEAVKTAKDETALSALKIKVESGSSSLRIATEYPNGKSGSWDKLSVNYTLRVPRSLGRAHVELVNGAVRMQGVDCSTKVESVNGSIRVESHGKSCELETVNAAVELTLLALDKQARVSVETVNGAIRVTLPEDAGAQLTAETVNGRLRCDFPLEDMQKEPGELSGRIGGGGAPLSLETVNGSIEVEKR